MVLAAVAAVAAYPISQLSTAQAGVSTSSPQASISWGACPPLAAGTSRDPRQSCGTVRVPLDYRRPNGRTIDIAVSRISTAQPGERRGYLLVNPGGPALEGLDEAGSMAAKLSKPVLDRYDLIGFDPRGVGHSHPISCHLSDNSFESVFPYPGAGGSIKRNIVNARTAADECAGVGPDLKFFTTRNTARDMDRIRQALGTPKISYWGQSYGTYLGAVYDTMFPQHADRVVLEGNVDPNTVWQQFVGSWSKGMAQRFPDAARVAAGHDQSLHLGRSVAAVEKNYVALADRLDRHPAVVPGSRATVSGATLRGVTYQLLMHNETIAPLTVFWRTADDLSKGRSLSKDETAVLGQVLADSPDEPGVPSDNQASMALTIFCNDASWSRDVNQYAKAVAADRKKWPLTAGMPKNVLACTFWHDAPLEKPLKVTSHGPRHILLLQNKRDNATPWDDGQAMRRALGSRAGFVGADNGGHYVYGTGSHCADQHAEAFLTRGSLPVRDVLCGR